jgi:hypothetical protein
MQEHSTIAKNLTNCCTVKYQTTSFNRGVLNSSGGEKQGGLSPPTFIRGGSFATANHMLKIIIMEFSLFFLNMGRRPHYSPLTFFVVSPPLLLPRALVPAQLSFCGKPQEEVNSGK